MCESLISNLRYLYAGGFSLFVLWGFFLVSSSRSILYLSFVFRFLISVGIGFRKTEKYPSRIVPVIFMSLVLKSGVISCR